MQGTHNIIKKQGLGEPGGGGVGGGGAATQRDLRLDSHWAQE